MHFTKLISFLLVASAGSAIARLLHAESEPSATVTLSSRSLLSHLGSKHLGRGSLAHIDHIGHIDHVANKFKLKKLGRKLTHRTKGGRRHRHGRKHKGGKKHGHGIRKKLKKAIVGAGALGSGALGAGVGSAAQNAGGGDGVTPVRGSREPDSTVAPVNPVVDPTVIGAGNGTVSDPNATAAPTDPTATDPTDPNTTSVASPTDPNPGTDGTTDPTATGNASTDPNATTPNATPVDPSASVVPDAAGATDPTLD
ncbi:hypothetical protein BDK51DRAFT_51664 [Blyttiomyces helicus]|uniref:Uncharacterized protein n=1 Tax=Blyttiomyces helicus TaxID=388810 RepID=A0A4P9W0W4_9FUNG|nr:hypothetical protein BDK51DRAFT_51664 [Blyttiomyces helicus]|eukprot:RKO85801.1 hypothetical protein BDK51DRAFT_51664 [Blyttiomyces helicus]